MKKASADEHVQGMPSNTLSELHRGHDLQALVLLAVPWRWHDAMPVVMLSCWLCGSHSCDDADGHLAAFSPKSCAPLEATPLSHHRVQKRLWIQHLSLEDL
jgi:hypothetical protein